MNEHTKKRISCRPGRGSDAAYDIYDADGNFLTTDDGEHAQIARRLCAAWNYVEGIDTADLEMMNPAKQYTAALQAEVAEYRAALDVIEQHIEYGRYEGASARIRHILAKHTAGASHDRQARQAT